MILNDSEIEALCLDTLAPMITPFQSKLIRQVDTRKVLSYGASSYGYDLRLSAKEFKIFKHVPGTIINPKRFNPANLEDSMLHTDEDGEFFILPGHSYGLGVVVEKLNIPVDVTALFIGKSSYARCGIIVNFTPGESKWRGYLTVEISNASAADARIYANEGIAQALFLKGNPCKTSYEDRQGKYQDQPQQIITARI
jgi:dCTP deaminase